MKRKTSELTARATAAWAHMTQPQNPMPPGIALDFTMNDLTDDRVTAKRALFGAAAEWLGTAWAKLLHVRNWRTHGSTGKATLLIETGDIEGAWQEIKWLEKEESVASKTYWFDVLELFKRTIALCREIEAA
jgi:hypothetical protein